MYKSNYSEVRACFRAPHVVVPAPKEQDYRTLVQCAVVVVRCSTTVDSSGRSCLLSDLQRGGHAVSTTALPAASKWVKQVLWLLLPARAFALLPSIASL